LEAAERPPVDHDLWKGHLARQLHEVAAPDRVFGEVDLDVGEAVRGEQLLRTEAAPTRLCRVDEDLGACLVARVHPPLRSKCRYVMPPYEKTEAIVLRSLRLREADRVVHLYTARHGRVGAVVKGVRRTRSRFGGRLEPFFRLQLVLYRGKGEL